MALTVETARSYSPLIMQFVIFGADKNEVINGILGCRGPELISELAGGMPISDLCRALDKCAKQVLYITSTTADPDKNFVFLAHMCKEWVYGTGHWGRSYFRPRGFEFSSDGLDNFENGIARVESRTVTADKRVIPQTFKDFATANVERCELSGVLLRSEREIDHRVPINVKGDDDLENKNLSIPEARKIFLVVSPDANKKKRNVCVECKKTGKRGAGGFEKLVPFWFAGSERYSADIGCNGCFWAYPEQWRREYALTQKSS